MSVIRLNRQSLKAMLILVRGMASDAMPWKFLWVCMQTAERTSNSARESAVDISSWDALVVGLLLPSVRWGW